MGFHGGGQPAAAGVARHEAYPRRCAAEADSPAGGLTEMRGVGAAALQKRAHTSSLQLLGGELTGIEALMVESVLFPPQLPAQDSTAAKSLPGRACEGCCPAGPPCICTAGGNGGRADQASLDSLPQVPSAAAAAER